MIEDIRNIKIYSRHEMTNEQYHEEKEHISTSGILKIADYCPAKWRFGEVDTESPALQFGTASHAAILEHDVFSEMFIRGIDKNESGMIASDTAAKSFLKDKGVKVKSGAPFSDLAKLCLDVDEDVKLFKLLEMNLEGKAINKGLTIIKPDDYDTLMKMRDTVFNDESNVEMMEGASIESSLFCEIMINGVWIKVKIRPDIITSDCCVPDYKTTRDIRPEEFGRLAYNQGYWMKQAFVCDVLNAAYDNMRDFKPQLFAQEKDAPYIYQVYNLTDEQIKVGREQYTMALRQYQICKDADAWPAYADGPIDLPTPEYIANRFGFEDNEIEISFED